MRKIVLTFGLISGVLLSAMMAFSMALHDRIGFSGGALALGYATMVLSSLFIYFGVRTYRDTVAGGTVRFGRAFVVGALIGAVAGLCYVATWEVIYYRYMPDFYEKYQAHQLDEARAKGKSEAELAAQKAEMEKFSAMYKNPVFNAGMTFLEPLPVTLIVSLISAGVLSRRKRGTTNDGMIPGTAASA